MTIYSALLFCFFQFVAFMCGYFIGKVDN